RLGRNRAKSGVKHRGSSHFVGVGDPRRNQRFQLAAMGETEIAEDGERVLFVRAHRAADARIKALERMIRAAQKQKVNGRQKHVRERLTRLRKRRHRLQILVAADAFADAAIERGTDFDRVARKHRPIVEGAVGHPIRSHRFATAGRGTPAALNAFFCRLANSATSNSAISSSNSLWKLSRAPRRMSAPPRPMAARSMKTNSRGGFTPPS